MLTSLAAPPGANLVIVYGRRRVGKTTLLQEFCKARGGMYLVARQGSDVDQLQHLSMQVARFLDDRVLAMNPLRSWDAFFTVLVDRCRDFPVIIDEFPYLLESTKELPSILQEYWDTQFSKRESFMVLCGSSVGMMESLLGYRSPIYGRRTGQILLEPLGFLDAWQFLPSLAVVENRDNLGHCPSYPD